jgi:hypothetical protein
MGGTWVARPGDERTSDPSLSRVRGSRGAFLLLLGGFPPYVEGIGRRWKRR